MLARGNFLEIGSSLVRHGVTQLRRCAASALCSRPLLSHSHSSLSPFALLPRSLSVFRVLFVVFPTPLNSNSNCYSICPTMTFHSFFSSLLFLLSFSFIIFSLSLYILTLPIVTPNTLLSKLISLPRHYLLSFLKVFLRCIPPYIPHHTTASSLTFHSNEFIHLINLVLITISHSHNALSPSLTHHLLSTNSLSKSTYVLFCCLSLFLSLGFAVSCIFLTG